MVSISAKAAARKLKSEGDTDKEALKIMNLQCPNCRDFFFLSLFCMRRVPFFFGLVWAWYGLVVRLQIHRSRSPRIDDLTVPTGWQETKERLERMKAIAAADTARSFGKLCLERKWGAKICG